MAEERFVVTYDGEAVHNGRLDARELGISLVGYADLLKAIQATQAEFKKEPPVSLEVHATEEGSFIVDLILVGVGSVWDLAKHVLTGPEVTSIANLAALVGVSQAVLRWIAKNGVPSIKRSEQISPDVVRIWDANGTVIEMPSDVFLAIRSEPVLDAAEQVVRPLEKEGIDVVKIAASRSAEPTVQIEKDDLPNFVRPDGDDREALDEEVEETFVSFVGVSLDGSGKYRVEDGESEYSATLADAEFLEAVLQGRVQFAANDQVQVQVVHEQYRTRRQVRTRHRIQRVRTLRRPGATRAVWDEDRDRKRK